jgi:hypothetical protein
MYAVQEGADASSLVSASKTYYLVDQYLNDVDPDIHNMDPTLNPQVYIYAAKVTCNGCAAIQSVTCTGPATSLTTTTVTTTPTTTTTTTAPTTTTPTTTTVAPCAPLNPTTQAGVIVDVNTRTQSGVTWPVVAQCTSCTSGTKKFYNTGTNANPDDAAAANQKAIGVQCLNMANFCVCDEANVCYKSGATAPTTVSLFPYCSGGVCHMYAVQEGPDAASLVSASKTYYLVDQYVNDVDPDIHNMNPALSPQVYIYAAKVTCNGCAAIQSDTCTGPATVVAG